MARGRVGAHKGDVKELFGWTVVDIQADDTDECSEAVIRDKLKKASGANYDLGSNAGGDYSSNAGNIKNSAANNYKTLEKVCGPSVRPLRSVGPRRGPSLSVRGYRWGRASALGQCQC